MKKIILILIAVQFILAPQIIKGFGVNNSHEYLEVNQKKKTVKKDIFGNTVIEDDKGNKKTIKKDIFGNTIIEDERGNKETVKKDIFGNTLLKMKEEIKKLSRKIFWET